MTPVQRATRAAEGYLELRMPDEAWEELENLEPELRANPDVLAMRVRIYLAKGMPEAAAIVVTGLVRVVPWSMPAREIAAEVMEKRGRFDAAPAMFEGGAAGGHEGRRTFLPRGRLLVRLGLMKEGCARLTRL